MTPEIDMKSFEHRFLNLALAGLLGAFTATSILAAPVINDFKSADSNNGWHGQPGGICRPKRT